MEHDNFKNGAGYFSEISIALRCDGYDIPTTEDGLLTVSMDGLPLCQISDNGSVRYRDADIGCSEREDALHQVTQEAETVSEYMRLMEAAPLLKAQGLDEDYKQLADFNGVVLAGHPTRYGVQFVTWQWSYDKKGVTLGHYAAHHYEDAKQDFALRAGLVDRQRLFSDDQLTELYRCASNELDNNFNLTYDQEKSIDNIRMQIRSLVPNLDDRLANSQTVTPQTEQTM
jgi:hypothetical protein